jgi:hypothetical protein
MLLLSCSNSVADPTMLQCMISATQLDEEFLKRNNGYESPAWGFTNLGQRFLASNDISLPSVREPLAAEMAAINASSHVRSFNGGYRGEISGARLSMKCRPQNHLA